jgi:hypothetical protein
MTIEASSIAIGGTLSATGGTATSVLSKGDTLEKHNVVLDDGSAFKEQTSVAFSIKAPKVSSSAPAGYTQARNTVVIQVPMVLANGNSTVNSFRLEMAVDPETTDADKTALRDIAAQAIFDADFDAFWNDQSMG